MACYRTRRPRAGLRLASVLGGLFILTSAPAHAILGFGVHGGKDFVSIGNNDGDPFADADFQASAKRLGYTDYTKWTYVELTRGAISNPWLFGGHFYLDFIPYFDVEVSADVALQKYWATYKVGGLTIESRDDLYFGRIGAYLTVRRDLIKLPPVIPIAAFYLGGGLSYHYVSPLAGPDLIVDAIGSQDIKTAPKIADKVEREGSFGYHGLAGVRVKPPIVPIAFRVEGKYTVTGIDTFERPGGILSAYAGISLDF